MFLKASFHSFPQGNLVIIFLFQEVRMVQFLPGLVNGMKRERPCHFTIFSLEENAPMSLVGLIAIGRVLTSRELETEAAAEESRQQFERLQHQRRLCVENEIDMVRS